MAKSDVYPDRFFHPWQVWPGAYDNPADADGYPKAESKALKISKDTPIAVLGSCFGREIKEALLADGYHVIEEEKEHRAARHASAAWERVYNTFSLRQIFGYTFDDWSPGLRWWQGPQTGIIQDPYRRIILYPTREEAERDFARHRLCSRRALEKARLLILTLETTEIWEDTADGAVISLPVGPYVSEGGDMSRYRFRVSRYRENLENMETIFALMARYNPECRIILMISPVHLWTTFREDTDVISAGCNAKSTLRAVADDCASRHENVFYFPALEIATTFRTIFQRPVFAEGRENFHVSRENVSEVMKQFYRFYHEGL
jgi:hypothetical protein